VKALDLLESFPSRFTPVITHRKPLDSIQSTFEMAEKYQDGSGKVVLTLA
jgi:threonine dehydrogenase-like Zn-dependent dehydrogenase